MAFCKLLGVLFVFVVSNFQFATALPATVDCTLGSLRGTLQLNSPQFAELCRFSNDVALTADQIKLQNLTSALVGLTPNGICEGDCHCVMGAKGGKCGARKDGTVYCKCDYVTAPATPVFKLQCAETFTVSAGNLICSQDAPLGNITYPLINDKACNSDCQCSHGYGNTGNHKCTAENGVAGNKKVYCVCEKGTNLLS